MKKVFAFLLLALPMTFIASHFHWSPMLVMAFSCLGIIPLAKLMGEATEHISHKVGPTIGGLVTATFGNACELIIALFALRAGLIEVVKASITGSIIGNILLVLGASMFVGGLKREVQTFNRTTAGTAVTLLTITALALLMPAAMHHAGGAEGQMLDSKVSLAISIVLIMLYFLGLVFSLRTHKHLFLPVSQTTEEVDAGDGVVGWSMKKSVIVLLAATLSVVFLSDHLVENVEHVANQLGMTPIFVGVILLAIIGNAAENSSAIIMAHKNKMDLSINIALGSSTQIAMFVAPVVVFAGYVFGQPMNLVFSQEEIVAVFGSVMVLNLIMHDGKSNWLEGFALLALYAIIGVSFFFIG